MATAAQKRPSKPKTTKRATKTAAKKTAPKTAKTAAKTAPKAAPKPKAAPQRPEAAATDPFAFAADMAPASVLMGQQDAQGFLAAWGAATLEFAQGNVSAAVEGTKELMEAKGLSEAAAIQSRLFAEGMERTAKHALDLQALTLDAVKDSGTPWASFMGNNR